MAAAQLLAEKNIDAVIAKSVGPRALDVLKQFNIEVCNGEGAVKDVLQKFIDKKIKKIN
jgi:predicted Fe-Mo cluster-binding NifX family protein